MGKNGKHDGFHLHSARCSADMHVKKRNWSILVILIDYDLFSWKGVASALSFRNRGNLSKWPEKVRPHFGEEFHLIN